MFRWRFQADRFGNRLTHCFKLLEYVLLSWAFGEAKWSDYLIILHFIQLTTHLGTWTIDFLVEKGIPFCNKILRMLSHEHSMHESWTYYVRKPGRPASIALTMAHPFRKLLFLCHWQGTQAGLLYFNYLSPYSPSSHFQNSNIFPSILTSSSLVSSY